MWKSMLAVLALASVATALAESVSRLVPAQSELVFVIRQMGVPVEGRFRRFDAQIVFDPKKPDAGSVSLSVDTASATMGVAEVDVELPKPKWFAAAQFPEATFQSTTIKALEDSRFEVSGRLGIKGTVRDVVVPITITRTAQTSGSWLASGAFTIKRLEFRIGENEWADTSMVANDVQVRFKFTLTGPLPL